MIFFTGRARVEWAHVRAALRLVFRQKHPAGAGAALCMIFHWTGRISGFCSHKTRLCQVACAGSWAPGGLCRKGFRGVATPHRASAPVFAYSRALFRGRSNFSLFMRTGR